MEKQKISVILAAYNGEKYIAEQLESISGQSRLPDEVLIGDDGSSDRTPELVRHWISEHPEICARLLKNEGMHGSGGNFYYLMGQASGDLVFFCDQDDVWNRTKIERFAGTFEEHPEIKALSSSYDVIRADGTVIRNGSDTGKRKKVSHELFLRYPAFPGMAMACRKETIQKTLKRFAPGCGAEKRTAMHDWAVNYTASLEEGMYYIDEDLSSYRRHGENVSGMVCFEDRKDRAEKRAALVQELIRNMRAAQDEALASLIRFEEKRLNLLKDRKLLRLFFYELVHLNYTRIKPLAGDIYSLL